MAIETLPGFREFYPDSCALRNHIFAVWRQVCRRHNFVEYDAPRLQPTELFTGKSGPEIVGQLFNFTDKGGREVTLPPEMTPYVCQMVGAKAAALKRPIRWFSLPECFRYERPQKGRLRSFYQLNADIFDEAGINAEVELLALVVDIFRAFGLTDNDFVVRLSDRTLWLSYLEALGLNGEQAMSILQIVDKWEREEAGEILKKMTTIVGAKAASLQTAIAALMQVQSLEAMDTFFKSQAELASTGAKVFERIATWKALLADLQAMNLTDYIRVDLGIVRGLAYYTGFVFEVFEKQGQSRAMAGGGRYDDLMEKVGGPKMPAMGVGLGDVTLIDVLTTLGKLPSYVQSVDLYMAYMSDATRAAALPLVSQLRDAGFSVEVSLKPMGFGKQMKSADKAGARKVIILGDDELAKGVAKLKCLNSGEEREVPLANLVSHLRGDMV